MIRDDIIQEGDASLASIQLFGAKTSTVQQPLSSASAAKTPFTSQPLRLCRGCPCKDNGADSRDRAKVGIGHRLKRSGYHTTGMRLICTYAEPILHDVEAVNSRQRPRSCTNDSVRCCRSARQNANVRVTSSEGKPFRPRDSATHNIGTHGSASEDEIPGEESVSPGKQNSLTIHIIDLA